MDTLTKQVRSARRRLTWEQFLKIAPWCWFAWLWVAAAVVVWDKFQPLGVEFWVWPAAALGIGTFMALVWTLTARRGSMDAAIEIDRRFGLRERVSSTLALTPEMIETPAGRALVDDAVRRVERIDVPDKFRVGFTRWAWLPLAPAAAAFALAVLWQPGAGSKQAQADETTIVKKAIRKEAEALKQRMRERAEEAKQQGLEDAEKVFKKLEDGADKLREKEPSDRQKALIELNDLAKDLEKRREALGGTEKIKEQFKAMKDLSQGPADKLADSLKEGDFNMAMKEIQQLKEQIKQGKLTPEQRDNLAKQLEEMKDKLNKMADAHENAMNDLKKQIDQKRQAGDKEGANKLQEQLDKLAQQMPQMKQANDLAKKLGECANCMKNGDMEKAMAEMEGMEGQLKQMQADLNEMAMLDEAMEQLGECKNGCMNAGDNPKNKPGMGLGRGRGAGERPEDRTKTGTFATKVGQKVGQGEAVITEFVEGPNVKGDVQQQIETQLSEVTAHEADPLTGQQLPRAVREHAQEYFDKVREGK